MLDCARLSKWCGFGESTRQAGNKEQSLRSSSCADQFPPPPSCFADELLLDERATTQWCILIRECRWSFKLWGGNHTKDRPPWMSAHLWLMSLVRQVGLRSTVEEGRTHWCDSPIQCSFWRAGSPAPPICASYGVAKSKALESWGSVPSGGCGTHWAWRLLRERAQGWLSHRHLILHLMSCQTLKVQKLDTSESLAAEAYVTNTDFRESLGMSKILSHPRPLQADFWSLL